MLGPEEAVRFHGHKGPYLAWGYRAARLAEERLSPKGLKDLVCRARLPLRTPYTCILDGVQTGSRCTLGKCNLVVEEGDEVVLVFECNGRVLRVKPAIDLEGVSKKYGLEEGFEYVLSSPSSFLFEVSVDG